MKYDNKMPNLLPDEPWFLIRGRDMFAVDAIRAYADLVAKESSKFVHSQDQATAIMQHALQCLKIAERFIDWQDSNKDKVRLPKPEPKENTHE